MILFQDKIMNTINSWNIDTIPHSILLCGEYGCGKHTLINYMSERFNIPVEFVYDTISDVVIERMSSNPSFTFYVINIMEMSVAEQNKILKFLEEPTPYSFIVLLCEDESVVIPTIKNRCRILKFDPYIDTAFLKSFSFDELDNKLFSLATTPGQVMQISENKTILKDAEKVLDFIDIALISNILILPEKLSYKDGDSGVPVSLFSKALMVVSYNYFCDNSTSLRIYNLTKKFYNDCGYSNFDKKKLYIKYLLELKNETRRFKETRNREA